MQKYKKVFWELLMARKKVLKVLTVQVFLPLSMILYQKRWSISEEARLTFEIVRWTQSDNTETTIPRDNSRLFQAFKMAVAIAFLRQNPLEKI